MLQALGTISVMALSSNTTNSSTGLTSLIIILGIGFIVFDKILMPILKGKADVLSPSVTYASKKFLLTKTEILFYTSLFEAVNGRCWIFPKVRLADIVDIKDSKNRSAWQTAFNQISRKHVDFVLCSPGEYRILALVELDDSSHDRKERQDRDKLVDGVVRNAGVPIIHIRAGATYSAQTISTHLEGIL